MNELFPLGTIVTIKGINKPVMIIGYLQNVNGRIYDYMGVPYPTGLVSPQSTIVFDRGVLEKLVAEGYKDEDGDVFLKAIPRLVSGVAAIQEAQGGNVNE